MDEGRFAVAKRQEDKHRKYVCILNDIIRTRSEVYENCLTREKYETSFRYMKNCMNVKRALVRQKVLQKCLEMRRRAVQGKPEPNMFGKYGGVPLHAMSKDVEQRIAQMNPKVRRLRKVQKLLRDSLDNGAILDKETASTRIEDFFKRRLENAVSEERQEERKNQRWKKEIDGKEDSLNKSITISKGSQEEVIKRRTKRDVHDRSGNKVSLYLDKRGRVTDIAVFPLSEEKNTVESRKNTTDKNDRDAEGTDRGLVGEYVHKLERRPTLVLPPITQRKEMVMKQKKDKGNRQTNK